MPHSERFDLVVVGSGFGGSVAAYRLADAGRSVCLLERGKAYPPGSFPRTPREMARNFWDPSEGRHGMFNVWSFSGLEAVVSSGLGGGSLIYANVLLRKDPAWFARENVPGGEWWPVTRDDLEPHYDRAESMLNAQRFPFDAELSSISCARRASVSGRRSATTGWMSPRRSSSSSARKSSRNHSGSRGSPPTASGRDLPATGRAWWRLPRSLWIR